MSLWPKCYFGRNVFDQNVSGLEVHQPKSLWPNCETASFLSLIYREMDIIGWLSQQLDGVLPSLFKNQQNYKQFGGKPKTVISQPIDRLTSVFLTKRIYLSQSFIQHKLKSYYHEWPHNLWLKNLPSQNHDLSKSGKDN